MVFPALRKWTAKHLRTKKPLQRGIALRRTYFRPAVELLEDRRLPSTVVPISLANGGPSVTPNGDSFPAEPSADGRFVVYSSTATNIVPGQQQDPNSNGNVFLYDRLSQTTTLVSHASDSTTRTGDGVSFEGGISADGRFIVYDSNA